MKFDLRQILNSKRMKRRKLSDLPISEKLAMLDVLRDRAILIRDSAARCKEKEQVNQTVNKYFDEFLR
jgi:hypothetical protein